MSDNSTDTADEVIDLKTYIEAPTDDQMSFLTTMCAEVGQDVPQKLSKDQASELIEKLQSSPRRGRGM